MDTRHPQSETPVPAHQSGSGRGGGPRAGRLLPACLLTVTGQEHGPVHQALQSLPEQLAGRAGGLQVQEALQHGQQLGRCWGAAHLGREGEGQGQERCQPQFTRAAHPVNTGRAVEEPWG